MPPDFRAASEAAALKTAILAKELICGPMHWNRELRNRPAQIHSTDLQKSAKLIQGN